jgi:hypothetical protein
MANGNPAILKSNAQTNVNCVICDAATNLKTHPFDCTSQQVPKLNSSHGLSLDVIPAEGTLRRTKA